MSDRLRLLITGFGPFPGAPFNPTISLVKRLTALRARVSIRRYLVRPASPNIKSALG